MCAGNKDHCAIEKDEGVVELSQGQALKGLINPPKPFAINS